MRRRGGGGSVDFYFGLLNFFHPHPLLDPLKKRDPSQPQGRPPLRDPLKNVIQNVMMRMRLLIRAMEKTLVSLWKWELIRMKTKKITCNLCLWLEQLHALDSWLDRDADDLIRT